MHEMFEFQYINLVDKTRNI